MAKGEGSGTGMGTGKGGFGLWGLGRNIMGVLCCLLFLGPILIIIGAVFIASATTNTRADNIKLYNAVVDDWTTQYRNEFQNLSFSVTRSSDAAAAVYQLPVDYTADSLNDHDSTIKTYRTLKYATALSTVVGQNTPFYYKQPLYQDFQFTRNNTLLLDSGVVPVLGLFNITQSQLMNCDFTSDASNCVTQCTAKWGRWDYSNGFCTVTQMVTDMCVKVSAVGSSWVPDRTYGDIGCFGSDSPLYKTQLFNPQASISFSGTTAIRSVHDPYVYAAYLTDGTFYFGMSRAAKVTTGFILIICGGCLLLPMVLICYCLRRRHVHRHYHHYHDTVTVVQQPYVVNAYSGGNGGVAGYGAAVPQQQYQAVPQQGYQQQY